MSPKPDDDRQTNTPDSTSHAPGRKPTREEWLQRQLAKFDTPPPPEVLAAWRRILATGAAVDHDTSDGANP